MLSGAHYAYRLSREEVGTHIDHMNAPQIIDASPTKEFFIYMLVRDVPLIRSIIDLIDNSVDGATRTKGAAGYSEFWIRIEISGERLRVHDNCGGVPLNVAKEYAFRFGRPSNVPGTPGSIGQFGVGMKRTIFKLGKQFKVTSTTGNS